MKTLLKKFLNQLFILMFTFTFVNIDVAVTKSEMSASFISIGIHSVYAEEEAKEEAGEVNENSGISRDKDGIASKEQVLNLEKIKGNGDIWTLITMIVVAMSLKSMVSMCSKKTIDMYLAIAGGVAFIIGEIIAVSEFKKKKHKSLSVTLREDGEIENKQVQMLEEQKKSYEEISKAAGTKIGLQKAANVAFAAAAAWAGVSWAMQTAKEAACGSALIGGAAESMGATAAACTSALSAEQLAIANDMKPAPSSTKAIEKEGYFTTLIAGSATCNMAAAASCEDLSVKAMEDMAICLPGAVGYSTPDENVLDYPTFFAENFNIDKENLSLEKLSQASSINSENSIEELMQPYQFASFVDKSQPLYNFNEKPIQKDDEGDLEFYIRTREEGRYLSGKLSSMSVNEFDELQMAFPADSEFESGFSDILLTAADKGMDLLVPKANAAGVLTSLGLTAAVAAIVWGFITKEIVVIDLWVSTPKTRFAGFSAMALLSIQARKATEEIKEAADDNAKKIGNILAKMKKLENLEVTSLAANYQQMAIPSPININNDGAGGTTISDKPTPCIVPGSKSGTCGSLQKAVEKDVAFSSLPSTLSQVSSLAGGLGDGLVGTTSLSGATLGKASELGSKLGAIQDLNKNIKKKINKLRKDNGKKPVDFDKQEKRFMAMVKKAMRPNRNSSSTKDLLAAFGGGQIQDKKTSDEKVKDDKSTGPGSSSKSTASRSRRSKKSGLNFSFGDDLKNEGAAFEEALDENAAKAAAMGLDEESEDDIHLNKQVSIFKIISVRYLKSGYSRLLEEE